MASSRERRYIYSDPTSADLGHPQFAQRRTPLLSHINAPHDARRDAPLGGTIAPMITRLPLESEAEAVIGLARMCVAESRPQLEFDETIARATFARSLATGSPMLFVAVDAAGKIVGVLMASVSGYGFAPGSFARLDALFVHPSHRVGPAAGSLMRAYDLFTHLLKAREAFAIIADGSDVERTEKLLAIQGYNRAATVYRKVGESGHVR